MSLQLSRLLTRGGSFARAIGIYTLSNALTRLCAFGALPFLSARIGSAEYGTIGLLMTSGWVMRAVANMGISSALPVRYFERDAAARNALVCSAVVLTLPLLIAVLLATAAAATPLSVVVTGAPGFEQPLLWFVASVALMAATGPLQTQQMLENRALAYSLPLLAGAVLGLVGTVAGVVHFGLGVRGWVYASVAGAMLQSSLVLLLAGVRGLRLVDRAAFGVLLRDGLPLLPLTFLVFGLQTTPLFVTRGLGDLQAAGPLAYALNFALSLQIVAGAFSAAWPAFFMRFRKRPDEGAAAFHTVALAIVGLQGLATIVVTVAGALLVQAIAAPALQPAAALIGWLSFAQFCATLIVVPQPAYYFAGRLPWITLACALGLAAQLAALASGFQMFGVLGAAAAGSVGSAVVVLLLAALAARRRWPGADLRWTRWAMHGLGLAVLIGLGVAADAFARPLPTLVWGAAATMLWLASLRSLLPALRTALARKSP